MRALLLVLTGLCLFTLCPELQAKPLELANLHTQTPASELRQLRRTLFRLGIKGARVDLGKGELHLAKRQKKVSRRLRRALARVGFPLRSDVAPVKGPKFASLRPEVRGKKGAECRSTCTSVHTTERP